MEIDNLNECLPGLFGEETVDTVDVDISKEAEEVDGLTSTSSDLLSLTRKGDGLLLSFVAGGKGGPQRLLNLRLVCSTTKGWVDDLRVLQGRRLFSNCQAVVDLSEDGILDEFLENPPPSHVTSLVLLGASVNFHPKKESWNRFFQFWSTRLTSLEVDESLPLSFGLKEFVASTSIRQLVCKGISCGVPEDVPEFLLHLEELRLEDGRFKIAERAMEDPRKKATLQILGSPKRFVIGKWMIDAICDLTFAADVLRLRTHDVNSQLTFRFGRSSWFRTGEAVQNFATAVAASSLASSIRIQKVTEDFLRRVFSRVEEEEALRFVACVESIRDFTGNFVDIFDWTNFPNLKKLECEKNELIGLPAPTFLPRQLTSLWLSDLKCCAGDLGTSLGFVNRSCPRLQSLKICWTCECARFVEWWELFGFGAPEEEAAFFPNLRSLTFHVEDTDPQQVNFVEDCRAILWEGLRLPQLSLTSLRVSLRGDCGWDDENPAGLFDDELLGALIEGPVGKTLCDVDIAGNVVAEGARELLETLEGLAEENERKKTLEMS